jgi:hypothetical protein
MKAVTFVLAGLIIAAIASPSLAVTREEAIHDCNVAAGKYIQHVWGNAEGASYRACMAQQGYQE